MNRADLREDIQAALAAIPVSDFLAATKDLLEVLGYRSNRTLELSGGVDDFIHGFPAQKPNTKTEQVFREHVQSVRIVFQLTIDEIVSTNQQTFGLEVASFEEGRQQSVIFFAVELKEDNYDQGVYDEFTREIDKRLIVPTVVFFRAGVRLTVAVIGRRPHKLDGSRDVLEHVTSLSKNIPLENPRRAHINVLSDLSLSECAKWMDANAKPYNCESLLAAWLAKLNTTERNRQFYRYTFDWFEQAVFEEKFPEGEEKTLRLYFYDIAESTPLSREREADLADRITFTNDECSLLDTLADEATDPPDANILRESARDQLETALKTLDERESHIIRLYFGLDGNEALTLEEIGNMMNLTRERIRQLKNRALGKLRHRARYQELKTLTM